MTEYVVTLTPDERASRVISRLKDRVRRIVGSQPYLNDEPHVTIYVGDLDADLGGDLDLPAPQRRQFEITGWEVFRDDTFTGNHTLASRVDSPGLNNYQEAVANRLAHHRARPMIDRFEAALDDFGEHERSNLREYGFPFIGANWIPHLTIASVEPDEFDTVWTALEDQAPVGEYGFDSVTIYELVEGKLRAGRQRVI